MSKTLDFCVELLVNTLKLTTPQAESHAFTVHCLALESRSARVRLLYPIIYLALGLILGALLLGIDPSTSDRWNKVFGAVIGVFSALLAFWNPGVELEQSDCVRLLGGRRLSSADLATINKFLALPTKRFDNTVKLISAFCSFIAFYLLTGK
jgi:hypothetical protein